MRTGLLNLDFFYNQLKNQRSQPSVLLHFFDNIMYFLYIQVENRLK